MENTETLVVTRETVAERVKSLLSEVLQLRYDAVHDELSMKDCDRWDSLKHMEIITSLEDDFEINLEFDQIVEMQSVQAIVNIIVDAVGI